MLNLEPRLDQESLLGTCDEEDVAVLEAILVVFEVGGGEEKKRRERTKC